MGWRDRYQQASSGPGNGVSRFFRGVLHASSPSDFPLDSRNTLNWVGGDGAGGRNSVAGAALRGAVDPTGMLWRPPASAAPVTGDTAGSVVGRGYIGTGTAVPRPQGRTLLQGGSRTGAGTVRSGRGVAVDFGDDFARISGQTADHVAANTGPADPTRGRSGDRGMPGVRDATRPGGFGGASASSQRGLGAAQRFGSQLAMADYLDALYSRGGALMER